MKKIKVIALPVIALLSILLFMLASCAGMDLSNISSADSFSPAPPVQQTPATDGTPEDTPDDTQQPPAPTPTPIDHTGGLNRNQNNILVGSAVLDGPVLLMGMGVDPVVVINVRDAPSLDGNRITTIGRGEVVEATEIVDGWYSVKVFPDMTNGYIRSDLLVPYISSGSDPEFIDDTGGSNIFTDDDPSGLRRGADGILIGSVQFDGPRKLMGMGVNPMVVINVRTQPDIQSPRVTSAWGTVTIGKGQMVEAFGVEDGWYRVRVHPGLFEGYIRSDLLVAYDDSKPYYAAEIRNYDTKMSASESLIEPGPLVDLRTLIPDIEYNMLLAISDNYTGVPQYSRDTPILQLETAKKLQAAQELFKKDGYRIKLFDAYRPSSVSGRLSEVVSDTRYVARAGTSIHNRAAAVDMTLIDADGNELEMPSKIHTFNSTSHRDSSTMTATARANMDYMTDIMKQVGMGNTITTEWWHFGDSEASKYLPIDIEFRDMLYTNER